MRISRHQVVDIGVLPAETDMQDYFGSSFDPFDGSVIGCGPTATAAMQDALNHLTLEGFDSGEVESDARDGGWFGGDAGEKASELVDPEDTTLAQADPTYFVGIRFDSPDVDDGEDDGEDEEGDPEPEPPAPEPVPVRRSVRPAKAASKVIDV